MDRPSSVTSNNHVLAVNSKRGAESLHQINLKREAKSPHQVLMGRFNLMGGDFAPRFKLTASARLFDVALEGRSTGTSGSYGLNISRRIVNCFMSFELFERII